MTRTKAKEATLAKRRRKVTGRRQASQLERADRVLAVEQLLLLVGDESVIMHWLTNKVTAKDVEELAAKGITLIAKDWSVSAPTARDYLNAAWRNWRMQDAREGHKDRKRQQAERRAELVYRKAIVVGDSAALRVALSANDQIARINGCYEPAPVLPPPMDDDFDAEEAARAIKHAASTLALAEKRGVITSSQVAKALDVEAKEVPAKVETQPDGAPAVPPAPGGPN